MKLMRIIRWVPVTAAAITLLLNSACAATDSGPTPPSAGTSAPASIPAAAAIAVTIHKTGGIAGVDETISVDAQGTWTRAGRNATPRTGRFTADQLAQLRTLATDPRLIAEATKPQSPGPCADAFSYSVTVATMTMSFTDCPTAANRPQATMAIVEFLEKATG
jgi:hypothetical protein